MDAIVIVSARDEADRLPATLAALADAFPGARVLVADDGSRDGTPAAPRAARARRPRGRRRGLLAAGADRQGGRDARGRAARPRPHDGPRPAARDPLRRRP